MLSRAWNLCHHNDACNKCNDVLSVHVHTRCQCIFGCPWLCEHLTFENLNVVWETLNVATVLRMNQLKSGAVASLVRPAGVGFGSFEL